MRWSFFSRERKSFMNINRYALRKERSLQKIISKQPKPNTTAIGVCSETQVTHHIITKRSDECLPISAYVPKHKEGDGKKFPVIIDIYGGDFIAGRSALNTNFGAWCAEQGYLTFIPEYTPVPETNLFGQLGDLLKAFVVIHRCCGDKDDSWTEAILYDNTGKEVVVTEPCDSFTGCWELKNEDTNTVYRAHVMTKSNLN